MSLIDSILNLSGLLLWFSARAAWFTTSATQSSISQAGTHKRESSRRQLRWLFPVALFTLVCGRAWFYWLLGPAVGWTGSLDLGPITIFFRPDQFRLALLFSILSFLRVLVLAFCWLLAVWVINRNTTPLDPVSSLIRQQLSPVAGWPIPVQLALPLVFVATVWPGLHVLLFQVGVANPSPPTGRLILQGLLMGLGTYLSLRYLIPALLFADLLARYIYFGRSPVWDFLGVTAGNILAPLRRLSLRVGRMDFAPLIGIVLTLLLLHWLPRLVLHELNRRNLTLWPQ